MRACGLGSRSGSLQLTKLFRYGDKWLPIECNMIVDEFSNLGIYAGSIDYFNILDYATPKQKITNEHLDKKCKLKSEMLVDVSGSD